MTRLLGKLAIVIAVNAVSASAITNLRSVVAKSDAVVVARASDGIELSGGMGFKLTVVRTLQGDPTPGQSLNVIAKLRQNSQVRPSTGVNGECGLFMLKRTSSGWAAFGSSDSPFFDSLYIPLGDCEAEAPGTTGASTAHDKAIEEIAVAARRAPTESAIPRDLFFLVGRSDSPVVARIMNEFAESNVLPLRAEGVAWRVVRGDPVALVELTRLASGPARSLKPACFRTAVLHYANTDKGGVLALGRIVQDQQIDDEYLKRSAAHALRNIHTPEAIPFLASMLDSADEELRMEAVSGLTEHVMGVRASGDGPEKDRARNDALNPGSRKEAPRLADNEHLHMGVFQSEEQEKRVNAYWREWWKLHEPEYLSAE